MTWIETTSLSFVARHEDGDTTLAEELLDRLEDLRLKLEERFEIVPGDVGIVVHPSPIWLTLAHPFLPAVRWAAAPAGRRYLAGWPMRTEVHVLGESAMEKRAAGEASLEALRGTAERLYTEIVVAANNDKLPPPWTPGRFPQYWRWAWLIEGAGQYFSRQVDFYRAAVIRRMREGSRPSFPPGRRDAILLGGTVFDLLEDYRGGGACELLVARLRREGPEANLEAAFDLPIREIEDMWREYLRDLVRPDPDRAPLGTSLADSAPMTDDFEIDSDPLEPAGPGRLTADADVARRAELTRGRRTSRAGERADQRAADRAATGPEGSDAPIDLSDLEPLPVDEINDPPEPPALFDLESTPDPLNEPEPIGGSDPLNAPDIDSADIPEPEPAPFFEPDPESSDT